MIKKIFVFKYMLIIILLFTFSDCSLRSVHFKQGRELYQIGNYDQAVKFLQKALDEQPKNNHIRVMLLKAKLNSYYHHLALARKNKDSGKKDEAIREYQIALKHIYQWSFFFLAGYFNTI